MRLASTEKISQTWPSRSWKARPYIQPASVASLHSQPPAAMALAMVLSTSARQSTERATTTSALCSLSAIFFAGDEFLEVFLPEQHGEHVFADDHAGGVVSGELVIEGKSELGEEIYRAAEIADRQIYEDTFSRFHCGFFPFQVRKDSFLEQAFNFTTQWAPK